MLYLTAAPPGLTESTRPSHPADTARQSGLTSQRGGILSQMLPVAFPTASTGEKFPLFVSGHSVVQTDSRWWPVSKVPLTDRSVKTQCLVTKYSQRRRTGGGGEERRERDLWTFKKKKKNSNEMSVMWTCSNAGYKWEGRCFPQCL